MTASRQHPAVLFRYSGGVLFALLAPVLPIALYGGQLYHALFLQLPLAAVVVLWGILRWKKCLWHDDDALSLSSGVLMRRDRAIPYSSVSRIELYRSPVSSLLGASRISVSTVSQPKSSALTLTLHRKNAGRLILSAIPLGLSKDSVCSTASAREIAALAASGSNTASGLLILIPMLSRLSQLGIAAGERLEESAYALLPSLPRIAALAALLPAVGWLVHFIYNCIVNARFECIRSGSTIITRRGIISRRTTYLPLCHICAVDVRRTLLLLFFKRASASVLCSDAGSFPIVPAALESQLPTRINSLITRPHGMAVELEPKQSDKVGYYITRLILSALSTLILFRLSRTDNQLLSFLFIPVTAALIWYTLVGIAASHRARAVLVGDSVEITGSRLFTVHTLRVYRNAIAQIKIKQSPLQKQRGLCDLYIRPCGQRHGISCRFLSVERAERFSSMLR